MTIEAFIELIGYNEEWFTLEFIPLTFVEQQRVEYLEGEDTNIQHYKWGAYRYFLAEEDFSDEKRVLDFIQLIENDPNEHLYKGALNELLDAKIIDPHFLLQFKDARFMTQASVLKRLNV